MEDILTISLFGSHAIIGKLTAFIFGSIIYLYWSYACRGNYAAMDNILKIINLKNFQIVPFSLNVQCTLRYPLQWIPCVTCIYVCLMYCSYFINVFIYRKQTTNFTVTHTHKHRDTQRHTQMQTHKHTVSQHFWNRHLVYVLNAKRVQVHESSTDQ